MLNALFNTHIISYKIQIKSKAESFLKMALGFWPVFVVYYGISKIHPNFTLLTALCFVVVSKLIILGLSVFFHIKKLPFAKSLTIVLSVGYGITQVIRSVNFIAVRIINNPEAWRIILYKYWFYILLNSLLLTASCKAASYLLHDCNYREIFSFHKIKFTNKNKPSWLKRLLLSVTGKVNRILGASTSKIFKYILEYRRWFLSFWFLPLMYRFWFLEYSFLYPNASLNKLLSYMQVMSVPPGVLFIAWFLYKPCNLTNRFGVTLAAITNIIAQSYAINHIIVYYYHHFPISYNKKNPIHTFKQLSNFIDNPNSWVFLLNILFFSIGCVAIMRLWLFKSKDSSKAKLPKKSINFGAARFMDLKGIRKINDKAGIPIGAIPAVTDFSNTAKVIKSIKKQKGDALIRIKTSHTTLIAPSRSGKGTGIIIPALLDYAGPVFVTDIKGENYCVTKRARESKGRKVYAFDPFGITGEVGVKINLLESLNPENVEVVNQAQALADLLCPILPHDSAESKHFKSQSAAVIECLSLYVTFEPDFKNNRNLRMVHDLLCLAKNDLQEIFVVISNQPDLAYGSASNLANRILATHHKELSSVFTTAHNCLKFLNSPQIKDATASSDIKLADIVQGEMDLYICIPPQYLSTQQNLLRLIVGTICSAKQNAKNQYKNELLMLLDEMPALGYLPQIEQIISHGAGYGMHLMIISQTIGLLKNVYPTIWASFLTNQLCLFFACSDTETCTTVSQLLGKSTIEVSSTNQGDSLQKRPHEIAGTSSHNVSDSSSETGRELLMPDEIRVLGDKVVLAIHRGEHPMICQRINYWERFEWLGLWDDNPLHKYAKDVKVQYSVAEYSALVLKIVFN